MVNLNSNRPWICCQIGAREHYAIPRALHKTACCEAMITDYWARGSTGLLMTRLMTQPLATRYHPSLSNANIYGLNAGFLNFEISSRLRIKSSWDLILRRNHWFQTAAAKKVISIIESATQKPIVFSYSYSANQIFKIAKKYGCKTVLGQIDPGPFEIDLVGKLHERYGITPLQRPPESYWENWREECRLADRIIVNSSWTMEAMVKEGVPENKIQIIPLAYQAPDDVSIAQVKLPDQFTDQRPLNILFLGQVIARKGVVELIEAIDRLSNQPVHWTIVGGGDSSLLEQLQQRSQVTVTGQVNRGAAVEFYQKADLFVLPTHSDGYAITLLEAAAFGLPIIASKSCGDVVRDGVDGLEISVVSGEAIAEAVRQILSNIGLLRNFQTSQIQRSFRTIDDLSDDLMNVGRWA